MQSENGGRRRGIARLLAAFFFAAGMLGCAAKTPATLPPQIGAPREARDLLALPQSVAAYFSPAAFDVPVLAPEQQARMAGRLRALHFAPWHRTAPAHSKADALWGLAAVRRGQHYGENLQPLGPDFLAQMQALTQPDSYPNTMPFPCGRATRRP